MNQSIPKWTEERTEELTNLANAIEGTIGRAEVETVAVKLDTTVRSVAAKLRKMGFDVHTAKEPVRAFDEETSARLVSFLETNSGKFTYAEIGEAFGVAPKVAQGKILSLELTSHVKPTPKVEAVKKFSDEETNRFIRLANEGKSLEAIADSVGHSLESVRGKALSLLRAGDITSIPKQESLKESATKDLFEGMVLADLTVVQLAEQTGKTARGIKTILTRRDLVCSDYPKAKRVKA